MARIRTLKPEFWDSPDTAKASHTARLFYVALWNWADDYGKGTASAKALIGFAFPNDEDITVADYPRLAAELHSAYDVVFYEADGRPYYFIPKFLKHQRTEKRAASRIPDPPESARGISAGQVHIEGSTDDSGGSSDASDGGSVAGTGEQGNRGTGEQEETPDDADAPRDDDPDSDDVPPIEDNRPDVERICQHLQHSMVDLGFPRPVITERWRDSARLLLGRDGRTEQQVHALIDWIHDDGFWRGNIKSMPTLRKQFTTLYLKAQAEAEKRPVRSMDDDALAAAERYLQRQGGNAA